MGTLIEASDIFLANLAERQHVGEDPHAARLPSRPLLDALPLAVYTTDAGGRITYYNEAAAELWGHRPVLGKNEWCGSWRLLWPDGRPMRHDECPMAVALREKRPIRGAEAAAERPDGTRVPFLAYPTPLWDESGALVGAVNTLVDITERKRAEVSGQRLASIVESSDDAIVSKDLDGIITTWNAGAQRLFGYAGEEVIGKPITVLIPPDRRDEEPGILARIRRGERVEHYETVRRRKDGSLVDISLTVSPVRDNLGRVVGASKIARDISERRRAEALGQRLAAIVESCDDAIVSTGLDDIITSWNAGAERLYGYRAEEMVGKPVTIFIPPDRHHEEREILARIRQGGRVEHYETVRQRKDGSLVEISLSVSPVRDALGSVVGTSRIGRDISERRRAQEQQRLLLREMNHRVKNLFALASGVVALSARSAPTAADLATAVRARLGSLARAHELTLPDLAHEGSSAGQATTLHALLQTIVSPYLDSDEQVIVTGCDMPVGSAAIPGFALLLHELAANAAKYGALTSANGRITVECSTEDGELRLVWQEDGGPPLDQCPQSEGFGTLLSHATVTKQFGGQLSRDWRREGLLVRMSLPLNRLTV
jgi:PAS domain S-box-containing protein